MVEEEYFWGNNARIFLKHCLPVQAVSFLCYVLAGCRYEMAAILVRFASIAISYNVIYIVI